MFFRRGSKKPGPEEVERAWRRAARAAVERDWSAAETWLERIVEGDSRDLDAYHALARIYRDQGAVGRAIRMHQNLLLRSNLGRGGRTDALRELARDFEAGGYVERAAATYEEILGEAPRDREVLERLVRLLYAQQAYPRALHLARRLRRRDRETGTKLEVSILLAHAQALHETGDHAGARAAIKRCLRRDRSSGAAWAMLGQLEAERGKGARALAAWKRGAVADEEAAAGLYPKIAAGYAAQGHPETFEEFLQTILQDRPFDYAARIALARNRASHGQTKRAIEELSRAIEVAPHDLALRVELGRLLLASGQESEALKGYADLLDALERGPVPDANGDTTGDTEVDA